MEQADDSDVRGPLEANGPVEETQMSVDDLLVDCLKQKETVLPSGSGAAISDVAPHVDLASLQQEMATEMDQDIVMPRVDEASTSRLSGIRLSHFSRMGSAPLQQLHEANSLLRDTLIKQMPPNPYIAGSKVRQPINSSMFYHHHKRDLVGSLQRRVQELEEANSRMTALAQISVKIVANMGPPQLMDVAKMVATSLADLWTLESKLEKCSEELFNTTKDLAFAQHDKNYLQVEVRRLESQNAIYEQLAQDATKWRAKRQCGGEPREDSSTN